MAYPVFQPQEPRIDINLFGESAQAGAKLGAEIPSALTSVIQGTEEGIDFASKLQAREAQTRNQQAEAQINELKLKEAQDTETEQIQSTKADLLANTAKKDNVATLETQKADFYQELNSADPRQRAQLVLGNKYAQLFAADKELRQQQLQNIYIDPASGIDPTTRSKIGDALKIGRESTYRDHLAAQNESKLELATTALYGDSTITKAAEMLNTTPEQVPYKIDIEPHGKYLIENGTRVPDIKAGGGWLLDPKFDNKISKGFYDIFDKDTGTVIDNTGSVNDKFDKLVHDYKGYSSTVSGQYKLRGLQALTSESQQQNPTNKKVDINTFGTESKPITEKDITEEANLTPAGRIANDLAKGLRVDPKYLKDNTMPTLERLQTHIEDYIKSPLSRGNPTTLKDYNDTVQTLSRSITDSQFDKSEGLKAQYTDSQVEIYNQQLESSYRRSVKGLNPFERSMAESTIDQVVNSFKINSPSDLYFVKQAPVVESVINKYVNGLILGADKQQKTIANQQKASKATLSFLAGVRGGSGS